MIDLNFGFNFSFKRDKSMDKVYEAVRPGLITRIKRAIYGRIPEHKQGGLYGRDNKRSGARETR